MEISRTQRDAKVCDCGSVNWIVGLCCLTVLGQVLIPFLCRVSGSLRGLRGSDFSNGLICTAIAIVLELGPAVAMGMLFPALAAAAKRSTANSADVVGALYLWNTIGSGMGAVMALSLLVPSVGTTWTIALAIVGYLAALALLSVHASYVRIPSVIVAGVVGAALMFTLIRSEDPLTSNIGMYLYGPDNNPRSHTKLIYFREGRSCNVLVTEGTSGQRALRVNGKVDAGTGQDQTMQLGCAYLSRFLRPGATSVCVIGLGSGTTSGASLLFPGTEITCFEIESEVYQASRYFSNINHLPWTFDRFRIEFDGARSAMNRSRHAFDLIISEPANPWMAGVSTLYTLEFYRQAKQHLRPGGIVAQWVQTYNFTATEFTLILRTIQNVFPHVALLRISTANTILIASTDALSPSAEDLDHAQGLVDATPDISKDLTTYFGTTDVRGLLLQHFILDEAGVRRLNADGEAGVNTDVNMRLEFDAPRQLFRERLSTDENVTISIDRAVSASWFVECIRNWKCTKAQSAQLAGVVHNLVESGSYDNLGQLLKECGRIDPDEPFFQVVERVFDERLPAKGKSAKSEVRPLSAPMGEKAMRIGVLLWKQNRYQEAERTFGEMVAAFPQSATSWMNLAVTNRALGRHEDASQAAQRAMLIDPMNEFVKQQSGSFKEGVNEEKTGRGRSASEVDPTNWARDD